ncbi:uncharacterized protein LOC134816120 [Bolinopsis microptera]|uniref:uncharacterized protein LOC134816120 n=1 Tax=Bolinopsis microptera TaxID=2820187 RepID=UPI003078EADA
MVQPFSDRLKYVTHPKAQELIKVILRKSTNLCLSADVTSSQQLLDLVEKVGPHICLLKTHIDIVSDFTPDLIEKLKKLSKEYDFLIFEDRKFADLGSTVQKQFSEGVYRISSWSDFINAHVVVGPGIIKGLKSVAQDQGLILIAQMSAAGNLCNETYTQEAVKMAENDRTFVCGFICTKSVSDDQSFLNFVPGVNISSTGDGLGQQWVSPSEAIEKGADVIIVGRGIYQSSEPAETAKEYKEQAFKAYLDLTKE